MSIQAVGNWFYFIGQQWANSLKVFLPKNVTLFLVVSLNAWWQAGKVIVKYFWWLIGLSVIFSSVPIPFLGMYQQYITGLVGLVILYLFYCAVRPSVAQKNVRYFLEYIPHGLFFLGYIILFWFLAYFFTSSFLVFLMSEQTNQIPTSWLLLGNIIVFFVRLANIFAFFFFLDSKISFENAFYSIVRGFKMTFYGLPFCLLITILMQVFVRGTELVGSYFNGTNVLYSVILSLWGLFLYLVVLCALNTFYIKRAHEDYDLYF